MARKTLLPKAPFGRILTDNGAARISHEGLHAFTRLVEERATAIAKKALELAHHSGRRTVQAKDVKLAKKLIDS
ncbi:MAG: histone family protein [Nanobdellota archaeon]